MSDISIERKLELVRSIREANNRNRNSLRQQQYILYGQKYDNNFLNDDTDLADAADLRKKGKSSTLGMRSLFAIILFSLFVILDYTKGEWLSVNAEKILSYIEGNYSSNGFAFMEEITYTLDNLIK
ncbi:MAG: hypothetical protein J1E83_04015 [Lachnospiraceae bacterium]|nr:hypothetical protein [Lachnospiraceae bacterium]